MSMWVNTAIESVWEESDLELLVTSYAHALMDYKEALHSSTLRTNPAIMKRLYQIFVQNVTARTGAVFRGGYTIMEIYRVLQRVLASCHFIYTFEVANGVVWEQLELKVQRKLLSSEDEVKLLQ
jgi:hypothetical protein